VQVSQKEFVNSVYSHSCLHEPLHEAATSVEEKPILADFNERADAGGSNADGWPRRGPKERYANLARGRRRHLTGKSSSNVLM